MASLKKMEFSGSPHLTLLCFFLLYPTADGPVLTIPDGILSGIALHSAVEVLGGALLSLKKASGFEKRRQICLTGLLICYYFGKDSFLLF